MSAEPLPPVVHTWRDRLWPVQGDTAASPAVLGAALAIGVLAAFTIRTQTAGSADLAAGLGVFAVALIAHTGRLSGSQLGGLVMTVGLLCVTVSRSAPWLVILCLFAAWAIGTVSLVGGKTWTGLVVAAIASGLATPRAARWVQRALASIHLPAVQSKRVWLVVAVTAALVAVFGGLFVTADAAYAAILGDLVPSVNISDVLTRLLILAVVTTAALTAAYLSHQPPAADQLAPTGGRPVRRWEWIAPLAALDLLFLSFVLVQLSVLFGGRAHVLATHNLTYSQYARQGFWQLLVVTGLTLSVVAIAVRVAPRATPSDLLVVRVLLAGLCLLALVVVASALHRMSVYENAYGFTRLRLFVDAVELVLGATFVLTLAAGLRWTASWLPRGVLALAAVSLIGLAVANPDAYIADHNVTRYEQTGRIDVNYLSTLSPDAVPALLRLPVAVRNCALARIAGELRSGGDPWYNFNLSRDRARRLLKAHPVEACSVRPHA